VIARRERHAARPTIEALEGRTLMATTVQGAARAAEVRQASTRLNATEGQEFKDRVVARFDALYPGAKATDFLSPQIYWGDGEPSTLGKIVADGSARGRFAVLGTHAYAEASNDHVHDVPDTPAQLTVPIVGRSGTRAAGTRANITAALRVADAALRPAPSDSLVAYTSVHDNSNGVKVGHFLDANPTASTDDYRVDVDWSRTSPARTLLSTSSRLTATTTTFRWRSPT
jgi:hypothetical protein